MKENLKMLQIEAETHEGYKNAAKRDGKFARQVAKEALTLYEQKAAQTAKKAKHINCI